MLKWSELDELNKMAMKNFVECGYAEFYEEDGDLKCRATHKGKLRLRMEQRLTN